MRRRVLTEKLRGHDAEGDVVYRYFVRPSSCRRAWIWLDVGAVPPFEGNAAKSEIKGVKGGWQVVRNEPQR